MKIKKVLTHIMILFAVSCSRVTVNMKKNAGNPNIIDKNLKSALLRVEELKNEKKNTLLLTENIYVDDCKSYWSLIKNHDILESTVNYVIQCEYLICDSLWAVSEFGVYENKVDIESMGEKLLNNLDFRKFPSSIRKFTSNKKFTLNKLFPKYTKAIKNNIIYEDDGWILTLKVIAILKGKKEKDQNWLVQMTDRAKLGNYETYSTLILNKNESNIFEVIFDR